MSKYAHRDGRARRSLWGTGLLAGVLLVGSGVVLAVSQPWDGSSARLSSLAVSPITSASPTTGSTQGATEGATDGTSQAPMAAAAEAIAAQRTARPVPQKVRQRGPTIVRKPPPPELTDPATFRVSSFNVLGASHTAKGGRHGNFGPGASRMRMAASLLSSSGVSVAGLQELQAPQLGAFRSASPGWGIYPGALISRGSMANSIVWRGDVWALVESHTIAIPYFGGRQVPMPYVLLRHLATGNTVWFANFHNPADTHGPAQRWRDQAVTRQIGLARTLRANGTPVVMTGDMNDRERYFCPMTTTGQMHSASGGSVGAPCAPPARMNVDWIMGSSAVTFANYTNIAGGVVARISDHPFFWADATVGPQPIE